MKLLKKKLIKNNFYTTYYLLKSREILLAKKIDNIVCFQFKTFDQREIKIAGMNEIIEVIKASMNKKNFNSLIIKYLENGTITKGNKCILSLTGRYSLLINLENVIDGILARRCSVASNIYWLSEIINLDRVIYMADRTDDYKLMPYDAKSAFEAGITKFCNSCHLSLINKIDRQKLEVFGSFPHSFIQQFDGDIEKATACYLDSNLSDGSILVDYDNDIIGTLKKIKKYFPKINSIRIDTSPQIVDVSLAIKKCNFGVNINLLNLVRSYLDKNFGSHIKIINSSNNNLETILALEKLNAPIDFYGIGSSLIKLSLHFTCDAVLLNNKLSSKVGRKFLDESAMKILE